LSGTQRQYLPRFRNLAWVPAYDGMTLVLWIALTSLNVIPTKAGTHASLSKLDA